MITTTYAGDTEEQDGTIFAVKKYEDHAEVIAAYEEVERVTYTRAFRVDYPKREEKKGGCKSTVGGGIFAALVSAAAIAIAEKRKNA